MLHFILLLIEIKPTGIDLALTSVDPLFGSSRKTLSLDIQNLFESRMVEYEYVSLWPAHFSATGDIKCEKAVNAKTETQTNY